MQRKRKTETRERGNDRNRIEMENEAIKQQIRCLSIEEMGASGRRRHAGDEARGGGDGEEWRERGGRREEGVGGRREGRQSDIFNFFGC